MNRLRTVTKFFVAILLTCVLATMTIEVSSSIPESSNIQQAPTFNYVTPALQTLNMTELEKYVETFSNFGTRFTGYPGCYDAGEYIYNEFKKFGLRDVGYHYFNVTVPVDEGAYVTLPTGQNVTLYPFLPNMVSPVQTPPGGITGKLIYVGEGEVKDFDGKDIDGSIVLMDMNTQYNWLTAAKYGAKAVIFIEPNDSGIQEFGQKVLDTAAYYFPRLYVKAEDAQKLKSQDGATVNLVSNMKFRQLVSRNIIGYLQGRANADQYILLTASYDSYSYVPSLAPGAREAIGISMLLQLAKYFASHPGSNQYTLVFVAFSGTNQGVTGSRWFVKQFIDQNWDTWGSKVELQMNFDIDDVNRLISPTVVLGWLWGYEENSGLFFYGSTPFGDWFYNVMKPDIAQKLNMPELNFDPQLSAAIASIGGGRIVRYSPGFGNVWADQLGGPLRCADSEPLANLGGPSFTWYNYLAFEKYTYTPFDTPDRIQWDNVEYKLKAIYAYVYAIVNTDLTNMISPYWTSIYPHGPLHAQGTYPKWTDVYGEIDEYNVSKAWYDPVPNALYIYRASPPGGSGGLSSWQDPQWVYVTANKTGQVFIPGLLEVERLTIEGKGNRADQIRAFVLNDTTGQITYAPALGLHWFPSQVITADLSGRMTTTWTAPTTGVNPQTFGVYTVFPCGNVVLFDIGDIYYRDAAATSSAQIVVNSFASHSPVDQSSWESYVYGGEGVSVAVLHVPSDEPIEIMTQTSYTLRYPFEVLTNSSENHPSGTGYTVGAGEQITITYPALKAAYDWFNQNSQREAIIAKSAVAPPARPIDTKKLLGDAFHAIETNNYTELESLEYRLLVVERNQYDALRSTIEDSVNAVTFFGFILVPFALVFERLVGHSSGVKRVLMIALAYGLPLIVLSYTHPGFALASNISMVIVGFLVLVLTSPLLVIIYASFLDALRRMREKAMGVHWIEMGRTSVAMLSVSLGVLNMRKRRLRTSLTLISVLLITVGVVLFTSVGAQKIVSVTATTGTASYTGIFVHQWNYGDRAFDKYSGSAWSQSGPQLGTTLLTELEARYGDKFIMAPRAWAYLGYNLRGWFVTSEDESKWANTTMTAVLGLTPQEANVTEPNASLVKGTWFTDNMDPYVTIIGTEIAKELNVGVGDMIKMSGYDFKVIGIANETKFNHILDLDGLLITVMDTTMPGYNDRLYLGSMDLRKEATIPHIIIIPYKTVLGAFDGMVVSVGMRVKPEYENNQTLLFNIAKEIYTETLHGSMSIPLYVGYGGTVYTLFPQNVVTTSGWQTQAAPLVIAALVLLNLMLGSIEERRRDIFTLSSVGLSPFHIGFLFLAEALTYAIVGGVGGYLISLLLSPFGASVSLNPASTTVVGVVTTMMAVTIGVTIYPIYVASKLVTPSLERRWKIPNPKGDQWEIMLPFSATRDEEAEGVLSFAHELAIGHLAPDSEVFRTVSSIKYSEEETPKMVNKTLTFDSELSPYELGIFQETRIVDVKEKDIGRHTVHINLYRKAGPKGSWITFGREFVDLMRKQILLWRSFPEEGRKQYETRFAELKRSMTGGE